jgi:hypothetical protein
MQLSEHYLSIYLSIYQFIYLIYRVLCQKNEGSVEIK